MSDYFDASSADLCCVEFRQLPDNYSNTGFSAVLSEDYIDSYNDILHLKCPWLSVSTL